jgi:L-xylulose reductase
MPFALVTGAGKGIGWAICKRLVEEGVQVIGVSRTEDDLCLLQQELGGDRFEYIVADIGNHEACQQVASKAATIGDVTMLVNCAGISILQSFLDVTPESWEKVMAVNVTAVMFLTQAIVRNMVNKGLKGSIVNISSTPSGYFGMPQR